MQALLENWSEAFHQRESRNPYEYYVSAQKAFPNVRAIAEMSAVAFKTCFNLFVEATDKYQELAANNWRVTSQERNPATD